MASIKRVSDSARLRSNFGSYKQYQPNFELETVKPKKVGLKKLKTDSKALATFYARKYERAIKSSNAEYKAKVLAELESVGYTPTNY